MYGCENWTVKKAECRRIDALTTVLEKTPESPLDCKEIQPVHSEGDVNTITHDLTLEKSVCRSGSNS